jgi:hypothetical protein
LEADLNNSAEEATEDFNKTATIGKQDGNVKDASISLLYRKRVFWLVILVFGNIFSGAGYWRCKTARLGLVIGERMCGSRLAGFNYVGGGSRAWLVAWQL